MKAASNTAIKATGNNAGLVFISDALGDILPIPIPLAYGKQRLVEKTIHSGCSHTERLLPDGEIIIPPSANRSSLYFFGYIDYLDNIGNKRRVAFCRRYIPEEERFITVQDENYEYSY